MVRRVTVLLTLVVAGAWLVQPRVFATQNRVDLQLTLGTGNYQFVVDGAPGFKVFVSYFDALDQSRPNVNTDLAYLAGKGVNGIRIFPNWWDVSLDGSGYPKAPYSLDTDTLCDAHGDLHRGTLTTLLGVLDDAKEKGLLVDISMAAETVSGLTLAEYTKCLKDLTRALANGGSAYRHVFIDVQNEYDNADTGPSDGSPLTDSQVAALVAAIKAIDPSRLVTASLSSDVLSSSVDGKADNANVDILAWHEPRVNRYWKKTRTNVRNLDDGGLPVYLQEPARLPENYINAAAYAANVYNAKNAYADAWTMHNAGSFELGSSTLQDNLQDEEKHFLDCLAEALRRGTCSSPPGPKLWIGPRG